MSIRTINSLTLTKVAQLLKVSISSGICVKSFEYGDSVILDVITETPWEECMQRKARSHLFIDQLYHPEDIYGISIDHHSIGKSGIEAMFLESLVFTRGEYFGRELPPPPVVWVGRKDIIDLVDYYINHPKEREEKIKEQKAWALKYATYDFAARNVLCLE